MRLRVKHSKYNKYICIALCAALGLSFSGCSGIYANSREIEQLQLIRTMGLDRSGEGVSLSVASGKQLEGGAPLIMSADAPSISSAMEKLQDYSAAEDLYFAHTQYLLIGEEAANEGLQSLIDYISRAPQMRQDIQLFVLKGARAGALVSGSGDGKYDITEVLTSFKRDMELRGEALVFTCADVASALAKQDAALVCAVAPADADEVFVSGGGGLTALSCGFAVLTGGELLCYIDEAAARGVCLLLGKVGIGCVLLEDVLGSDVSVTPTGGKASLSPVWENGALSHIDVELSMTAAVQEMSAPLELSAPEVGEALNAAFSEAVEGWVRQALEASRKLEADFLDIGGILRRDSPLRFADLEKDWPGALGDLDFRISSKCSVTRSFDLMDPVDISGGGKGNVTGK